MRDFVTILADTVCDFLRMLPLRDRIVFESNPEFADNTYCVYRYLVDYKHIDENYKIVWLVEDKNHVSPPAEMKNTTFQNYQKNGKTLWERLKYHYYINTSRGLIYCNRNLGKKRRKQFSLCLQHGMPLKASNGGYCIHDQCDRCLCVSAFFADHYHKDFDISYEKMFFCPFPRTDYLFSDRDVRAELGLAGFDKVLIWMPTYRKSAAEKMKSFNIEGTATGIPCLETEEDVLRLDAFLREKNSLVLFKPHPVQPIDSVLREKLTNIRFIDNAWLAEKGVQLYELLGKTDGLITDYSSVYYDYLLTDRPVGLTVDDYDEYIGKRGFVYDDPFEVLKGEHITDADGLIAYIDEVVRGEDPYSEDREIVKDRIYSTVRQVGSATAYVSELFWKELQNNRGGVGFGGSGDGV
ncbi:MAG: CDP-glycerol glycerophosphotransferase family protein [Clostridia bacterium]|nr:CDP-glycerol glycerophosphotransferase family protein [Clostridia bacterium]